MSPMERPLPSILRPLSSVLRSRQGATAIETALLVPALLLFLMGAIEMGRAMWTQSTLQYACDEGGRYAIANTSVASPQLTSIENRVRLRLVQAGITGTIVGADSNDLNVGTATVPGVTVIATSSTSATTGTAYVTITATHAFQYLAGILQLPAKTIITSSRVPLM